LQSEKDGAACKFDRNSATGTRVDTSGPKSLGFSKAPKSDEVIRAHGAEKCADGGACYFAHGQSTELSKRTSVEALSESWIVSLTRRDRSLLYFILEQDALRAALTEGPVVELRASGDDRVGALLPYSASVEINSRDAGECQAAVRGLSGELRAILIRNALQFLTETRQFLGLCFSKLRVGGMMIVVVPHQFLYERKLRLPSRRNPLHRRFYTSNTLLADIEEAIDPCECRVRFVGENDSGYNYRVGLSGDPDGGQDIVVALEKIPLPAWRAELDHDELWMQPRRGLFVLSHWMRMSLRRFERFHPIRMM